MEVYLACCTIPRIGAAERYKHFILKAEGLGFFPMSLLVYGTAVQTRSFGQCQVLGLYYIIIIIFKNLVLTTYYLLLLVVCVVR